MRNKVVGRVLAELRRGRGLTQSEVAGRLGHTQSLVSKVESGERGVPLVELWAYADAIEEDPAHLVEKIHDALVEAGLDPVSRA